VNGKAQSNSSALSETGKTLWNCIALLELSALAANIVEFALDFQNVFWSETVRRTL